MSHSANQYFDRLVRAIDPGDLQQWEYEITNAEQNCLTDRTAMDIIGAAHVEPVEGVPLGTAPPIGVIGEWIQLAIDIEEKQYV
jgi:hypothetical protein